MLFYAEVWLISRTSISIVLMLRRGVFMNNLYGGIHTMNEFVQHCERELKKLEKIRIKSEESLKQVPKGSLRVSKCKTSYQYYWRNEEGGGETYIKKSNHVFAEALAQKDYASRMLNMVRRKEKSIRCCIEAFEKSDFERMHEAICDGRKQLIEPYYVTDREFVNKWRELKEEQLKQSEIQSKYALNDETGILTERREFVRSKTEKIIADKLNMMGVPYVYEAPLWLTSKEGAVYPDFMVLNISGRKELYWEHFGMMEKEEYCEKALKKLEDYARDGIYPGKKLIVTYETSKRPLNIDVIEGVVKAYLK